MLRWQIYKARSMQSYSEESRSLWRGSQEQDQYLSNLYARYEQSYLLLEFSRLADARREDVCKLIAKHLESEGIVTTNAKDLANLLRIVDVLQRSVVYSLFAGDNSIALQTARDIYATTSGRVAATLPFPDLIDAVLVLLKKELLNLVNSITESDTSVPVSADFMQAIQSIFDSLQDLAADRAGDDDEPPKVELNQANGISFSDSRFISGSYIRNATEQSLVIIALFFVTGFSLSSFKHGLALGLIGGILCFLLRVDVPANVDQGTPE